MENSFKQKAEKLHTSLKQCGFEQITEQRPINLECFFQVPQTRDFFDWLLENSNELCMLTGETMSKFNEKASKGHVIPDLHKLEEMHKLMNFKVNEANNGSIFDERTSDETIASLERDLRLSQSQLEKTAHYTAIRRAHKTHLTHELNEQQLELNNHEQQRCNLEKKANYVGNNLKSLNLNLSKSISEFRSKFNDEEKFTQKAYEDLNNLEFSLDSYLKYEKKLLNSVKESLFLKFEFDGVTVKPVKVSSFKEVEISELNEESRDDFEFFCQNNEIFSDLDLDYVKEFAKKNDTTHLQTLSDTLKVLANWYPNLVEEYLDSMLSFELNNSTLNELNKINESKFEFFSFCNETSRNNAYLRQHVDETISEFEKKAASLKDKNEQLGDKIATLVEVLSTLKLSQVMDVELDKRKVEYSLFLNKLDKLSKALNTQRVRLECKDFFQDFKINEMENLKQLLEELNKNKAIYTSPTKSNQSFNNSLNNNNNNNKESNSLGTSLFSTSMTNLNMVGQYRGNTSTLHKDLSFSASMANLNCAPASSTVCLSPTKSYYNVNFARSKKMPSIWSCNPHTDLQLSTNKISVEASSSNEARYVYLLNQALIRFLSEMNSDERLERWVKLEDKTVSTSFKENLEILLEMSRGVNAAFNSRRVVNVRKQVESLNGAIGKAVEYLYEREEEYEYKSKSKLFAMRYDLKKSQIRMPRFLLEPLESLEKMRAELENNFFTQVLTKLGKYKTKLETNSLEQLRRGFFVQFYTNQRQIENTINYLNSISFER